MPDPLETISVLLGNAELSAQDRQAAENALTALERQLMSTDQRRLSELRERVDEMFERAVENMPLDERPEESTRSLVELHRALTLAATVVRDFIMGDEKELT